MYKGSRFFKNHMNILLGNDCLVRSKHFNQGFKFTFGSTHLKNCFHQSQLSQYPKTKQLPLPLNIKDLASSEKLKFSPQRTRDISGSYISCSTSQSFSNIEQDITHPVDGNVECYDCSGAINLSSAMQTNVPFPFVSRGKPIHLNMPGGQWGQKEKYVSEDLNNAHHTNIRELKFFKSLLPGNNTFHTYQVRTFCSVKDRIETGNLESEKTVSLLSKKEKLKAAVKDYGVVIFVFHIGISLISLGCFYALVTSGVDLSFILKHFGVDDGATAAGTAAHFIIAYALHKTLGPLRITVTLTAAPFLVKKLRKIGVLKTPTQKPL